MITSGGTYSCREWTGSAGTYHTVPLARTTSVPSACAYCAPRGLRCPLFMSAPEPPALGGRTQKDPRPRNRKEMRDHMFGRDKKK